MLDQKGLTPLLATGLLVGISVILGALVMTWGEAYVEEKAAFVQGGVQEVPVGCEAVSFTIPFVGGAPDVRCAYEGRYVFTIDNGPDVTLWNLHARVLGTEGVYNNENVLAEPLDPINAVQVALDYGKIGNPIQLKLTPKIQPIDNVVICPRKAVTIEPLPKCPG